MKTKKIFLALFFVSVMLMFLSCGGGMISIKMLEPAQHPLPGVKAIAVADFTAVRTYLGSPADDVSNALSQALLDNGFFKVIERAQLKTITSEHQLSVTGLTEESASQQIGQLLGANAIITGHISDYSSRDFGEEVEEKRYNSKTKEYYMEKVFKAFRKVRLEMTVKIINVATGEIMVSKNYAPEVQRNVARKTKGEAISALPEAKSMLAGIINNIVKEFVNQIAPHTIYKGERLISKGKDLRMKDAFKFARGGLWDNAIPIWEDIAEKGVLNDQKAALYNLAIAYQALADYDGAIAYIDQALQLGSDSNAIAKKTELQNLKRKREEVIKQLQDR